VEYTSNYYKTILGFTRSHFKNDWQWGWVRRDGLEIMFAKSNEHMPYSGANFTGSFYFNVHDADEWYESLEGKASIYYPIENFERDESVCNKRLQRLHFTVWPGTSIKKEVPPKSERNSGA
jgi:hypothetical protein